MTCFIFMGDVLGNYEMEKISCIAVYMTYRHHLKRVVKEQFRVSRLYTMFISIFCSKIVSLLRTNQVQ